MPVARPSAAPRHARPFRPRLPPAPLVRVTQPTVSAADGHRSLRPRQHGHPSLPLPPMLDPVRVAAVERYTAPKCEVIEDEQTDFQRQFAGSPLAQALATPIRQCHVTRARLPSHFLLPFSASITPNADDAAPPAPKDGEKPRPSRPIAVSLVPRSRHELPPRSALPSATYVLNTHSMIQRLGKKRAWSRIVGQRMQDQYARRIGKKDAKNVDVSREWAWDAQMPETVLARLREDVRARIEGLRGGDGGVEPFVLVRGGGQRSESCAVILVPQETASTEIVEVAAHTPIYPLEEMLGAEGFESVSKCLPFNEGITAYAVSTSSDRRETPLLLALHRLAMYLEIERTQAKNGS